MPLLSNRNSSEPDSPEEILRRAVGIVAPGARTVAPSGGQTGLFNTCANPECRSGWLQMWRKRTAPIFEGAWTCGEECMSARMRGAVKREMQGRSKSWAANGSDERPLYRHRIPLGLLMMEQGWITVAQLRGALESQRKHGTGRLGSWLMKQEGVSEELVTRALGLQWSCPVLHVAGRAAHMPAQMAPLMPRLFVDAFGALPLRLAAGKILYLGFESRLDPVLALAAERMLGIKVECGVVAASEFTPAHERMLRTTYPEAELVEAASVDAAVRVLTRSVERVKPAWSKLVRVHDFLWLRMGRAGTPGDLPENASVEDAICSIGGQ